MAGFKQEMKLDFIKNKNRLWIEVESGNIGMVAIDDEKQPVQVAIKLEGRDLLKLWKKLVSIGFA